WCVYFFNQKSAYELETLLEFIRVLFRSVTRRVKHSLRPQRRSEENAHVSKVGPRTRRYLPPAPVLSTRDPRRGSKPVRTRLRGPSRPCGAHFPTCLKAPPPDPDPDRVLRCRRGSGVVVEALRSCCPDL